MKPTDIATIGIRLVGVASITFGAVLALSGCVMHFFSHVPGGGFSHSDLHLHDTYYVVSAFRYDLFVPSGAGIVVGVLLILLSRRLGPFLVRGIEIT